LLYKYQAKLAELNLKKDELVLAEKLFDLKISTYKELMNIEEDNKKLEVLYGTYKQLKDRK